MLINNLSESVSACNVVRLFYGKGITTKQFFPLKPRQLMAYANWIFQHRLLSRFINIMPNSQVLTFIGKKLLFAVWLIVIFIFWGIEKSACTFSLLVAEKIVVEVIYWLKSRQRKNIFGQLIFFLI